MAVYDTYIYNYQIYSNTPPQSQREHRKWWDWRRGRKQKPAPPGGSAQASAPACLRRRWVPPRRIWIRAFHSWPRARLPGRPCTPSARLLPGRDQLQPRRLLPGRDQLQPRRLLHRQWTAPPRPSTPSLRAASTQRAPSPHGGRLCSPSVRSSSLAGILWADSYLPPPPPSISDRRFWSPVLSFTPLASSLLCAMCSREKRDKGGEGSPMLETPGGSTQEVAAALFYG